MNLAESYACVTGAHHNHTLTALLGEDSPPTKSALWCETCGRYLRREEMV